MHGFNTGMAIGAMMLNSMDAHRERENARRTAAWARFEAAVRDGREGALRGALAAALGELQASWEREGVLEVRLEDAEAQLDALEAEEADEFEDA